jgi:thiol-disulfide isomerase/thioredoxin
VSALGDAPSLRARWTGRALIGVIAAVMVIDLIGIARGCDALRPPRAEHTAPDFSLPRIDPQGLLTTQLVSLSSLRGRAVVIDFWATWCQPCRQSMPIVSRAVAARAEHAALLSVCTDGMERPAEARRLVDELAPGATLVADDGEVADRYGVSTIPHMIVIDGEGRIRMIERRISTSSALTRSLDEALAAATR